MGGKLDKQKLSKNKELTKQQSVLPSSSNTNEKRKAETEFPYLENTNQYENQVFDITSNFQRQTSQESRPPLKKKTKTTVCVSSHKELRRERLEKDLCSSTTRPTVQAKNKIPSKPHHIVTVPPPKLPEMVPKHKYTTDLFYNSILVWDPVWLEQGKDELELSTKLNSVPILSLIPI